MEETENFREVDVATSAKFFGTKITSFSILLMIVASIIAIDAFDWFEGDEDGEDESDLVKTNPPPEIDLQQAEFILMKTSTSTKTEPGIFVHTAQNPMSTMTTLSYIPDKQGLLTSMFSLGSLKRMQTPRRNN